MKRSLIALLLTLLFPLISLAEHSHGRAPYTSFTENEILSAAIDTTEVDSDELSDEAVLISDAPILPPVTSDSLYIARLKRLHSVMDLPFNSIVRNYIKMYTEQKRDKAEAILGLSEYYFPLFEQILDQYGMPLEIKYLAVIESALNPRAVSWAGATGLWQFMYATGRMYGLNVTSTVDDRRDPIAATHAAARHLRDLYNIFNDWSLALAAYNCGTGNVNKAIRRSGRSDFWGIYNYLPRETRGYVPAFIGAAYMMNYATEHNLTPAKYDFKDYFSYDTVRVTQWMHFDQISALVGISKEKLRDLNPQYRRDIIPGNERPYTLKLPVKYMNAYIDNEKKISQYLAEEYSPKTMVAPAEFTAYVPSGKTKITHTVRSGEVLGGIASRYSVRVQDLKQWNALRNNTIRVGQKLSVYVSPSKAQLYAKGGATTTANSNPQADVVNKGGFLYYQVKPGDTIWSISQQYKYLGVTTSDLLAINNMTNSSKIVPGQTIKIKKIG